MSISGLNHITLAVTDIEESFSFYHEVLGFKPIVRWDEGAYFLVGDLWFCLNVDSKRMPTSCYTHYAFTVTHEDFERMKARIGAQGAPIFKDNTSPGESLYFLDPDGHKLELHVGNLESRIQAKKAAIGSWQDVEWFV